MAQQTKLQQQIEASAKRIQEEQRRLKQLEKQQAERDRKDRNHRLCKRHGFLESILPDSINLTDEQFQEFVKNHVANKFGKQAIADFIAKNAKTTAAQADTPNEETNSEPAPIVAGQNQDKQQSKQSTQNSTTPAATQGASA